MMKDSEAFVSGTKKFVISEAFVAFERGTRSARPYQANKTHIIFKTSNIVLLIRELSTLSRWPAAIIKLDSNHANPVCFAPMQYRFEFHSLLIQNKLEAARVVPHIAWGCCERCKNRWLDTVPLARDTGKSPRKSASAQPMSQCPNLLPPRGPWFERHTQCTTLRTQRVLQWLSGVDGRGINSSNECSQYFHRRPGRPRPNRA